MSGAATQERQAEADRLARVLVASLDATFDLEVFPDWPEREHALDALRQANRLISRRVCELRGLK